MLNSSKKFNGMVILLLFKSLTLMDWSVYLGPKKEQSKRFLEPFSQSSPVQVMLLQNSKANQ